MAKDPVGDDETSVDDKSLMSIIATRVRETRRSAKLKQSELATMIGSSQSYVFMVEAAEANITIKTLVRLAQALKVEPIDLLIDKQIIPNLDKERAQELFDLIGRSIEEMQTTTHKVQAAAHSLTKLDELLQQVRDLLSTHRKD